jgi:hypothetical protein
MVDFKRLLNTSLGQFFISVMLGLGLATLFRKVCKDRNCINFHGPVLSEIEDKIYKHDNSCYKYKATTAKCDSKKQIVDISEMEVKVPPVAPATKLPGSFF